MANKVEIVINADGSRAIKAMQDVGATARATGKANADAAKATALAAKFAGDMIKSESVKAVQAMLAQKAATKDLAQVQAAMKKGFLDEAVGTTAAAAAYQRLTAKTMEATEASKKHLAAMKKAGHEWATIREHFGGGLSLGGSMGESMAALASIAAVTEGVMKMKEAVTSSLDFGEAIQHAAEQTGLAVSTLSTLHYAAAITGSDFDKATMAVGRLQKQIGEAAAGDVQAQTYMKDLGFNAKELAGRTDGAEIAFRRFAQIMATEPAGVKKTYLAMGLLGRAGMDQIPVLIKLGTQWEEMTAGAKAAGMMLDGPTADALSDTNERLRVMKQHLDGVELSFTGGLTNGLDQFAAALEGGSNAMSLFNAIGERMAATLNLMAGGIAKIGSYTMGLDYVINEPLSFTKAAKAKEQWRMQMADRLQQDSKNFQEASVGGLIPSSIPGGGDGAGVKGNGLGPLIDPYAAGKAEKAANKAAEQKMKADEAELAQMKLQMGKLSATDEFAYWSERIGGYKKGSDQYNAIMEKQAAIAVAAAKAAHESIARFQKSQETIAALSPKEANDGIAAVNNLIREQAEDGFRARERWKAYNAEMAKSQELRAKAQATMRLTIIEHQVKTGAMTKGEGVQAAAGIRASESAAQIAALQRELSELQATQRHLKPKDYEQQLPQIQAKQVAVQNQISQAQVQAQVEAMQAQMEAFSDTGLGGAVTALQEFTAASRDSAAQMKQFIDSVLSNTNRAIMTDLTEKPSQQRGAWKDAGKGIFTDIAGQSLKKGEGSLMSAFGIGGKGKLGTRSNPMIVEMINRMDAASASLSAAQAQAPGLMDLVSPSSRGKSLFGPSGPMLPNVTIAGSGASHGGSWSASPQSLGQSLFGPNGPKMPNVTMSAMPPPDAAVADTSKGMMALLSMVIPHFASGGDFGAGTTALVGEQGPEIVHFGSAGHVTPNGRAPAVGSTTTHVWNIDARGSNNPAQTMAMVQQGIMQAAPHLIKAANSSARDAKSRIPPSARQ